MIDRHSKEKIEARAFEIYEWRTANNVPGSDISDWEQAQSEVIADRRTQRSCPACGFDLLARNDGEVFCLRKSCDWKIKAKRRLDEYMPDKKELK